MFDGISLKSVGDIDIFTAKYDRNGNVLWVTSVGGTGADIGTSIATNGSGMNVVTGYFENTATFGPTTLHSAGYWDMFVYKVASGATSVHRQDVQHANSFRLSQNYPNPFNPTTTINFTLPVASKVKVTIYNVNGEVVRKLMEGERPAGYHELTFDAGDLASGIYFYRLDTGDFTATQKMILAK